MHQHPAKGAAELLHVGAGSVSATLAMGERHHPIHAGRQRFALVAPRHQFRGVRGAIAGRRHGYVVARSHPAVLAHVAQERRGVAALRHRKIGGGKLVLPVHLLEGQVVGVDVPARRNRFARASDGLAIAHHHLPGLDVRHGYLVPGGDGIPRRQPHAIHHQPRARGNVDARHGHVVGGMQMDDGILRRGKTDDVGQHWTL